MPPTSVMPFRDITMDALPEVGGKNASLGELIRSLTPQGIRVPDGFAITADAFRRHLRESEIDDQIYAELDALDLADVDALAEVGHRIRALVRSRPLPEDVAAEITAAYQDLSRNYGDVETDVAVRSSATAEDLPDASFAGQQESFLNVRGATHLLDAVRACMASLFTNRAIVYRAEHGFAHREVALSVGVQKMVRSDLASAGVIFTLDTETGFREVVLITGAWGLGEYVVQGQVDPDEFWIHKATARAGFRSVLRRDLGSKAFKLVYGSGGSRDVERQRVSAGDRARPVLNDDEILELSRWAMRIEDHYSQRSGRSTPMDIEWAKDGRSGELFIVQARPETVHSQATGPLLQTYRLRGSGEILTRGKNVGGQIASGAVRVIHGVSELSSFQQGEVLVAGMTDPDWEPILRRAAAVVTDHGGRTCHAAIVAREIGIPCVVGTGNATQELTTGTEVTVSCASGDEGLVYRGRIPFERSEIDLSSFGTPSVPPMLNLANPDAAFQLAQLPSAGVGLLRIEFLINHWIGIHPMALLHPERVPEPRNAARSQDGSRLTNRAKSSSSIGWPRGSPSSPPPSIHDP